MDDGKQAQPSKGSILSRNLWFSIAILSSLIFT